MSNTIRLYVAEDFSVIDEATLISTGMEPDKVEELLPGVFTLYEIWLKKATTGAQQEITRKCQVPQVDGSTTYDVVNEPCARFEVMVEKWNGPTVAPTKQAFLDLHPNVSNMIDAGIRAYMYPQMFNKPNFIKALNALRPNSAQETPAP
jgi:hypothetical protein